MDGVFAGETTAPEGSRSRSGFAGKSKLSLGPLTIEIDSNTSAQEFAILTGKLADDSEVMRQIADDLVLSVRQNIESAPGPALLPQTVERKARSGWSASPLFASGALYNGIEPKSRKGYAAARRGVDQWYGFLHEFGIGRLEPRPFMGLEGGAADAVEATYSRWLDTVLGEASE